MSERPGRGWGLKAAVGFVLVFLHFPLMIVVLYNDVVSNVLRLGRG